MVKVIGEELRLSDDPLQMKPNNICAVANN